MTTITTRVVKTRDAATSILRKLGLKPNAYGLFMKKLDDGRFEVDLPKVHEQGYVVSGTTAKPVKPSTAKPVKPSTAKAGRPAKERTVKAAKEPKTDKPKKEPKARKASISSVAEELILAGKTNEQVFAELKEKFKLDDSKKSYPSWYRCRLRRQGKLPKE